MKIYCNRKEKSDLATFKYFEGKDLWIKVSCQSLAYVEGCYFVYIRIIGVVEDRTQDYLVYNELIASDIEQMSRDYPDYLLSDICNDRKLGLMKNFEIVRPMQIYTTDEIWEILIDNNED